MRKVCQNLTKFGEEELAMEEGGKATRERGLDDRRRTRRLRFGGEACLSVRVGQAIQLCCWLLRELQGGEEMKGDEGGESREGEERRKAGLGPRSRSLFYCQGHASTN